MIDETLNERLTGLLDLELGGRRWMLNYEEEISADTTTTLIFHHSLTKEQIIRHVYHLSESLKGERFTVVEQNPTSDDQNRSQEEPPH